MEKINQTYVVRQKELKKSKNDKPYLKLELVRQNNRIFALMWKEPESFYNNIHFEDILEINGKVETLNNREIITIHELKHINENINVLELQDLLSVEFADQYVLVLNQLSEVQRVIVKSVFDNKKLYRLANYPAGKLWAFNKQGGLWKKTNAMVNILKSLTIENLDVQLIKTAILLKSLAFIDGLTVESVIEYKAEAKLIGLANLALLATDEIINQSKLSSDDKLHLKHLVLMLPHYRKKYFQVQALTKEAKCMESIHNLITDMDAWKNIELKEENGNRKWSNFNKLLNRQVFFPNRQAKKEK